jgi:formylglycine-generating enzyme required for sulfatase activity
MKTHPAIRQQRARKEGPSSAGTLPQARSARLARSRNGSPPASADLGLPLLALPRTRVRLARWPVRVRDFARFVAETGYRVGPGMLTLGPEDIDWCDRGASWRAPGFAQTGDHPVVGVSHGDAAAFCRWLTRRERAAGRIGRRDRYRLPTDREWSQAVGLAREPGISPEARLRRSDRRYPWGPDWPPPPNFGNYAGEESRVGTPAWWGVAPGGYRDPYPRTSPVGSFPANPLGFQDLSGNVWEWCADRYAPGGLARVTRGGSWGSDRPAYLQSANRTPRFPETRTDELGFRIALEPGGA